MPDLGPAPDREATGPFTPGDDLLLFHATDALYTSDSQDWPGDVTYSALMVTARLGSLTPSVFTRVLQWYPPVSFPAEDTGFWFGAQLAADSSTVALSFSTYRNPNTSTATVTVPWQGGDHLYTWAWVQAPPPNPNQTGTVYGTGACSVLTDPIDSSPTVFRLIQFTRFTTATVPASAPADLVVEWAGSWWDPPSPAAPSDAQIRDRLKAETCRQWNVGFVGSV